MVQPWTVDIINNCLDGWATWSSFPCAGGYTDQNPAMLACIRVAAYAWRVAEKKPKQLSLNENEFLAWVWEDDELEQEGA